MSNLVKSHFSKVYTRLTGLTTNIEDIIAATPDEEKPALYQKISWQIKRGLHLGDEELSSLYKEFLPTLADKCNIDVTVGDVDQDGDEDLDDTKIKEDLDNASKITVVTEEPDESLSSDDDLGSMEE